MSRGRLYYTFADPENFGAKILLGSLGEHHLLFADAHVLPFAKRRRFRVANALPGRLHPLPFCWHYRFGDSRGRHVSRRVNRIVAGLDKFRQEIDISLCIFICKIFLETTANCAMHAFYDCTFQVGVPTHLKLNAPRPVTCPEIIYLDIPYPYQFVHVWDVVVGWNISCHRILNETPR